MQPKATQQGAIHRGQALALCWLLQQPLGAGGEVLAGLTRTLAFSRPLSGCAVPEYSESSSPLIFLSVCCKLPTSSILSFAARNLTS